jgi:hypothetical protein
MLRRVVWQIFTDVSEELFFALIIDAVGISETSANTRPHGAKTRKTASLKEVSSMDHKARRHLIPQTALLADGTSIFLTTQFPNTAPWRRIGKWRFRLHAFLTSALDESSASLSGHFTLGEGDPSTRVGPRAGPDTQHHALANSQTPVVQTEILLLYWMSYSGLLVKPITWKLVTLASHLLLFLSWNMVIATWHKPTHVLNVNVASYMNSVALKIIHRKNIVIAFT